MKIKKTIIYITLILLFSFTLSAGEGGEGGGIGIDMGNTFIPTIIKIQKL